MRSRLWGGASAVLLLILIVEWAWPIPSLAPGPPAPLPSLAARAVLPARQTAGWVSLILARPLFTINRRPAKSAAGPAAAAAGDARLCGIMISATLRRAIFAPEGGGKPLVLGEGASVNDSVIARILPDRVIMASGTVLLPLYDHTRAPQAGAAPFMPTAFPPNLNPAFQPPQQTGNEDGQQGQPNLAPFRGPPLQLRREP
jgi:hypothetical protein